jgi:hypothetical protein
MRLHVGEGHSADAGIAPAGAVFANLNTLADDKPDGRFLDIPEAQCTQNFLLR